MPESETREAEVSFGVKARSEVELVHPWPEWIELMERLVQQNYFDHRRKDEDKMIEDLGFDHRYQDSRAGGDAGGLDFSNFKLVQTACVNFGKDRFDILRSLSRQDIQNLVGLGCPSADKKVVFSAKLLRRHVHLDEGDVCSSCSLRNSCERAYLLTLKEDEARTIDIMRVLLAYGFDPLNGSVVNQSLLKQKSVKTVVRKLLHEVVKLSSVPIDPNLPPPIIRKPPPKVKQPPPPPRKRVGRDDIEMKKGDWLCPKCDFMNFAKNTVCLQCDAKRPKRQLLPGEWECPQCNFLNYRRNTVCFHCDCKRPPDEFMGNRMQEKQHGPGMMLDKMPKRSEVSNAWNFDFDDDESDGADVAAFEYADSPVIGEATSLDNEAKGGNFGRPEYDFKKAGREPRIHDAKYSDACTSRRSVGFDDFDDEEDDIDNYELETGNRSSVPMVSSNDLSEFEGHSESEDIIESDNARHRTKSPSYNKQPKVMHKRRVFSGSDDDELDSDSDSELSANPKWKSSHVTDFRSRNRGKFGSKGPSKSLSFGSEDELGLYSDMDDDLGKNFGSRRGKANDSRQRRRLNSKDDPFSGSESENDNSRSRRGRFGGKAESNRKGRESKGRSNYNFTGDTKFTSNRTKNGRRNSLEDDDDDFGGSSKGYPGRGFRGNNNRQRMGDRRGDMGNFTGPRNGGFGKPQGERRNSYDRGKDDKDFGEFRNSRRVIER